MPDDPLTHVPLDSLTNVAPANGTEHPVYGHVHRWGTRGREHNVPLFSDRCLGCDRLYAEITNPSTHIVDPALDPRPTAPETYHVCDRWGALPDTLILDTDDPSCTCRMCNTRRWDRLTPEQKKRVPRP